MSKATLTDIPTAVKKGMQTVDDRLIRSANSTSIISLKTLACSLLFAELSMIAYLPEAEVRKRPAWLGAIDTQVRKHYLDANGQPKQLNLTEHRKDIWNGFVSVLKNRPIDHFEDHLMDRYVDYIYLEVSNAGDLKL